MSVSLYVGKNKIAHKTWKFPGGEVGTQFIGSPHISIGLEKNNQITIKWSYRSNDEFFEVASLLQVTRLRANKNTTFILELPYIPYSRQDRMGDDGEANSVKMFANLLNTLGFDRVLVLDPHSDVSSAVIDNICIKSQRVGYMEAMTSLPTSNVTGTPRFTQHGTLTDPEDWILIAPDAGAIKKVKKLAQHIRCDFLTATKHRDEKTGIITNVELNTTEITPSNKTRKNFIVVDDICDGGGTFIPLAEKLFSLQQDPDGQRIDLYTSHGIYSKGLDDLLINFDNIICNHLMNDDPSIESRVNKNY